MKIRKVKSIARVQTDTEGNCCGREEREDWDQFKR